MKINLSPRRKGAAILASVFTLALVLPRPAAAIFGFGDIVFDPSTFGQAVTIAGSNASILGQTIQMVQQGMQEYNLAKQMAQRLDNKQTWITAATGYANNFTRNQYGETVNWSAVLNGHPEQAFMAYQNATLQLNPAVNLNNENLGASYHLANLATVEAIDGTNQACLQAVAQYHQNQTANAPAFGSLNGVVTDVTDATNAVVAQLNALAGGNAQLRAEQISQSTLQSCLVQQQMLQAKIQRDNEVEAFNMYAAMQQQLQSNPMQLTSMSSTLTADIGGNQ